MPIPLYRLPKVDCDSESTVEDVLESLESAVLEDYREACDARTLEQPGKCLPFMAMQTLTTIRELKELLCPVATLAPEQQQSAPAVG